MDFSSLDLLASTALRDNNQSQADTSSSTPSAHPHIKLDDNPESDDGDDDEPDGEKDGAPSVEAGTVETRETVEDSDNMGSVKVGKNKKGAGNASKPVLKSIFVRDGKYTVTNKSFPPDGIIPGGIDDGQEKSEHSVEVTIVARTKEKSESDNNGSNTTASHALLSASSHAQDSVSTPELPTTEAHLCNGSDNIWHKSQTSSSPVSSDDDHVRIAECVEHTPAGDDVPIHSKVTTAVCDSNALTIAETLSDTMCNSDVQTGTEAALDTVHNSHATTVTEETSDTREIMSDTAEALSDDATETLSNSVCDSHSTTVLDTPDVKVVKETEETVQEQHVPTETCNSQVSGAACDSQATVSECDLSRDDTCDSKGTQVTEAHSDLKEYTEKEHESCDSRHLVSEASLRTQILPAIECRPIIGHDNEASVEAEDLHSSSCTELVSSGEAESNVSLSDNTLLPNLSSTEILAHEGRDSMELGRDSVDFTSCTNKEIVQVAETDGCINCDENRAVQPISLHPLPPSSSSLITSSVPSFSAPSPLPLSSPSDSFSLLPPSSSPSSLLPPSSPSSLLTPVSSSPLPVVDLPLSSSSILVSTSSCSTSSTLQSTVSSFLVPSSSYMLPLPSSSLLPSSSSSDLLPTSSMPPPSSSPSTQLPTPTSSQSTVLLTSSFLLPSLSPPLFPTSSSTTASDKENAHSIDNLDQDIGSSGNNNDINTSTSSLHTTLSPVNPHHITDASADRVLLDHCYFCSSDKLALGQSVENTDDSGDAFESADENVSADDIERRPRSLSVDSEYLQYGVNPTTSQTDRPTLLSPTLSVDSISNDSSVSEHSSVAGGHFYSILMGNQIPARTTPQQRMPVGEGTDSQVAGTESSRLTSSMLDGAVGGPKCGKFRIGTFGSFSNSHLDLEPEGKKLKIGIPLDSTMKSSISSPALASPGSPFPLLQSPGMEWDRSDAGSETPDDLDSSTTEDKFLSSSHDSEAYLSVSSQVWNHPVFHDHDYCCKEVSEKLGKPLLAPVKSGKRKNVKKKDRLESDEEKLKKGKYLKMELLKQDNRFSVTGGSGGNGVDGRALAARSSLLSESLTSKPNPVGRPRKRFEKPVEEYDAETGTKMKITGKYQDQYVYYYSKTSRNRRRKVDDKIPAGDKIILPPSKPGDIVVPHLTDADCEAIRRGGRSAFKGGGAHSFNPAQLGPPPSSQPHFHHSENGEVMDSDTSIVNTILSMECDSFDMPPPAHMDSHDGDLDGITENLTSEQVDLLLDYLKDIEVPTTSKALDNILTSAEPAPMVSNYLDSLTTTTVEEDFLVPGLPLTSASSLPPTMPGSVELLPSLKTETGVSQVITSPVEEESPAPFLSHPKQEVVERDNKAVISNGMPSTSTSRPSVEKNLEFLKNPNIKSDFYPAPPTSVHPPSSSGSTSCTNYISGSTEVETPWIVTVTLYWNDIPAIIISNTPYVRLVDIHRQILPAKDTGILKKRCQLMHIQVSNCTEMQRYFLVQYGRAHNSKSTLVISKDEAWRLISYYANPQPRNLRGEDGAALRRGYGLLSPYVSSSGPTSSGGGQSSPAPAFAHPRKRGGFRRRNTPTRSSNPSPEPVVAAVTPQGLVEQPPPSPLPAEPASPSKRLRHKKINFLEMLKGEDSVPHASSPVVEDGVTDVDLGVTREEGGGLSSTKAAKYHHKRRGSKQAIGGGFPAKRGRHSRQHSEEVKKMLLGVGSADHHSQEPEITVDGDSPDGLAENVKNKKRSPGSSAAVSLSATTSHSPKSKLGPIKVNVKSLVSSASGSAAAAAQPRKKSLFGRKSSSGNRVLRISHQDVEAATAPRGSSPVAEVHLDLYKRALSPCVYCSTCDQFLSVPGFLKHHHSSDSFQGLFNSARRMLVPMNKENISAEEQHLWNEFVSLQACLDNSASMGAYPLPPAGAAALASPQEMDHGELLHAAAEKHMMVGSVPHSIQQGLNHEINGLDHAVLDPETAATFCGEGPCSSLDITSAGDLAAIPSSSADPSADLSSCEAQISVCSPFSPPPFLPSTHTETEEKLVVDNKKQTRPAPITTTTPSKKATLVKKQPKQQSRRKASPTNVRTSSRMRKRKQFYGFENYEFAGGKKNGRVEDAQDSLVDVTGTTAEDEVSINGIDAINGPLASPHDACVGE